MLPLISSMIVGGAIGALLGCFAKCNSGACPLTANWRRGAFFGAVMGALFYSAPGCGGDSSAMNLSTANVKHITEAQFDAEVTRAALPVVVDCYATWCGPCRMLAPIVDEQAQRFARKIKFVKVNVEESPKLAQKFRIESIPTLLFFKHGKLVETSVGLLTKEELSKRLDRLVQTNAQPAAPGR